MSLARKSNFTKNISKHRNYAFILYILTAVVDFFCILYYGGSGGALLVLANFILLAANGCCGTIGTLRMDIIAIMCNFTWVSIIMLTYIVLLLATFVVTNDVGYQLIAILIPTGIDCVFMCAISPFLCQLCKWFDDSAKLEKGI